MDNIGVFDRNVELPTGGYLNQSDGTSWMGMYCLNMLRIALELAKDNPCYEDIASKFFEHFLYIADAMNRIGEAKAALWNEDDGCDRSTAAWRSSKPTLTGAIWFFSMSITTAITVPGLVLAIKLAGLV